MKNFKKKVVVCWNVCHSPKDNMHKIQSTERVPFNDQDYILIVACPIVVERNNTAMQKEFAIVEIDGKIYNTSRYETFSISSPLHIGEHFGILIEQSNNP